MAPLTITVERERVISFTQPFMLAGISVMIKKPLANPVGTYIFFKPFSYKLWLSIFLAYITASLPLYFVNRLSKSGIRRRNRSFDDENSDDFNLKDCFWFAAKSIMLQGSEKYPRYNHLVMIYYICSILMILIDN